MFKHILVPLDGSGFAEAALPYALEMAAQFDSDITLLRVVLPPRVGEGALSPESASFMIKMRDDLYKEVIDYLQSQKGIIAAAKLSHTLPSGGIRGRCRGDHQRRPRGRHRHNRDVYPRPWGSGTLPVRQRGDARTSVRDSAGADHPAGWETERCKRTVYETVGIDLGSGLAATSISRISPAESIYFSK